MTVPGDALLAHDYTLNDLERMARWVAHRRLRAGGDRHDAYGVAYGAIAEALYSADERPGWHDLMNAGARALEDELAADRQAHGRNSSRDGVGPRFHAYWWQRATHFPDDRITDRIALVQILPLLTPRQCEVLLAYTAGGSLAAVSGALGISTKMASRHLSAARATVRQWWHEHETPVTHRGSTTTCGNGHPWAENEVTWAGRRFCRLCHQKTARRGYWSQKDAA